MATPLARSAFLLSVVTLAGIGTAPGIQGARFVVGQSTSSQIELSDSVAWDGTIAPILEQDLWVDATAYDAGHFLMVPLHAAFALHNDRWQSQFAAHFARFAAAAVPTLRARSKLNRLQYDYLASRFAVLALRASRSVPTNLVSMLADQIGTSWDGDTAWAWGKAFPGGIRDRLAWKLSSSPKAHGYYGAIDDEERYVFAIAADLKSIEGITGRAGPRSATIGDILQQAERTFAARGQFQPDGGWLFQPGIWSDYPDYLYAGRTSKAVGMSPAPVRGIAEDASHSFRMPLILRSLAEAYPTGSAQKLAFLAMGRGLAVQFIQHVLVPPSEEFPGYRTTNFMDGSNGVYRWQYRNRGVDWGFGPYELSGSLTLGWWTFAGDEKVKAAYRVIAQTLQTSATVERFYSGNTAVANSKEPRGIIRDSYKNGLRQLIVSLAGKI